MDCDEVLGRISDSIMELEDTTKIQGFINEALKLNISPREIIEDGIRKGLEKVGIAYERGNTICPSSFLPLYSSVTGSSCLCRI